MEAALISAAIGLGVGALLGTLGGGGSILAVPLLVYTAGMAPQVAVTTSAAMVGMNSAMGAFLHNRRGALNWRVALWFGGAGMLTSYLAAGWSKSMSPDALMAAFAGLMLMVGVFMLRVPPPAPVETQRWSVPKVVISGAVVGLVTGILGVGGGFLIVPALVMLIGLPMREAIGTSLLIIAMNSAASFAGHLSGFSVQPLALAATLLAGALGTFMGTHLGGRLPAATLRKAFAFFVIGLALVMLLDTVPKLAA